MNALNTNTAKDLIWTNQNYDQLASTIMRWFIGMLEFRKQGLGEEEGARSGSPTPVIQVSRPGQSLGG